MHYLYYASNNDYMYMVALVHGLTLGLDLSDDIWIINTFHISIILFISATWNGHKQKKILPMRKKHIVKDFIYSYCK